MVSITIYSFESFSPQHQLMDFHWRLSDSKSSQVSRILTNLNNAVIWMVFTHVIIFKSSTPFTNRLVTVPSALITISITITFMFHSFFSTLARSRYLSLFLSLRSARTTKSTIWLVFLLTISRSGHLAKIRWFICISKSQRILSLLLLLFIFNFSLLFIAIYSNTKQYRS